MHHFLFVASHDAKMKKPPGLIRGFSKESDQLSGVRQTGRGKAMVKKGLLRIFGYWIRVRLVALTDQRWGGMG
jgi:hypothetical protein